MIHFLRSLWAAGVCVGLALSGVGELRAQAPAAGESLTLAPQLGTDRITAVAVSRDGRLIVTGGWGNSVWLWDATAGKQLRSFPTGSGQVDAVAISPDGRYVAGSGEDTFVWSATTGELLHTMAPGGGLALAFSHDGKSLLAGDLVDNEVGLWDMATGKRVRTFRGHTNFVNAVAFSPDDQLVLTGSGDSTARLWSAGTGAQIRAFETRGEVKAVAFSRDGGTVLLDNAPRDAGADNDSFVWLLETSTGRPIRPFVGSSHRIHAVALSPDGRYALTGGEDKTVQLWEVATGRPIRRLEGPTDAVKSVAFSDDGQTAIAGGWDEQVRLWSVATGALERSFRGRSGTVRSLAFSADGRYLATSNELTARLWDLASGRPIRSFEGHRGDINAVAFSKDGSLLLTGSDDQTARLWDTATGVTIRSFAGASQRSEVLDVAFSPDERTILTASGIRLGLGGDERDDHTARLWDARSGSLLRTFTGHTRGVSAAAFSPDGTKVLTGSSDCTARLWDAATGKQLLRMSTEFELDALARNAQCVDKPAAFSADGNFALTGEVTDLPIWKLATGTLASQLENDAETTASLAFSNDGRLVATGHDLPPLGGLATVRIWDWKSEKSILALKGHTGGVKAVKFSPDGRFVASGSSDTTTRIWDLATGKQVAMLLSFENGGWAVTDNEGRFDTNDLDGHAPLAWVVGSDPLRALPLEIFMRDYYTPGLLARILQGQTLPPVRSIAEIPNRVQPAVQVVSVLPSRTKADFVDLVVHAESVTGERGQRSGLRDLRVFRNGQMIAYLAGPLKDGDVPVRAVRLPLGRTQAIFTAYAFSDERIKSPTASFSYAYTPSARPQPRAFLVQIGVNHYQAADCELYGAVNDATVLNSLLAARLQTRGYQVVAQVLTSSASHPGTGKDAIHAALKAVAEQATPDDVFFLSFSGHGYSSPEGQFYLMPSSIRGSCRHADAALLRGAIAATELAEWLRAIDAGAMTFVLDSCYSAQSVQANDFKPGPMGSQGLGQLAYDKRMRILVASQSDATAADAAGDGRMKVAMGLLTYQLTEKGLVQGKADWNPVDHTITVAEWLGYAAKEVPLVRDGADKARGLIPETTTHRRIQVPVVFDFAGADNPILQ